MRDVKTSQHVEFDCFVLLPGENKVFKKPASLINRGDGDLIMGTMIPCGNFMLDFSASIIS